MTDIHKHCPVCNTPIPLDETTCSQECQEILAQRQKQIGKSRLMSRIILIIIIIAFIAIFAYQYLL